MRRSATRRRTIPGRREALIHTARFARLLPGDGGIDLVGLFARLPRDLPISVEVPNARRHRALRPGGMGAPRAGGAQALLALADAAARKSRELKSGDDQMDFALNEEQTMLVDTVRSFIAKELAPLEDEIETTGVLRPELARAVHEKAKALGLYAMNIPVEFGGGGLSAVDHMLAEEQFGRTTDILIRRAFGNVYEMLLECKGEQIERWLKPAVTRRAHRLDRDHRARRRLGRGRHQDARRARRRRMAAHRQQAFHQRRRGLRLLPRHRRHRSATPAPRAFRCSWSTRACPASRSGATSR